jgi:hypothetical protein
VNRFLTSFSRGLLWTHHPQSDPLKSMARIAWRKLLAEGLELDYNTSPSAIKRPRKQHA